MVNRRNYYRILQVQPDAPLSVIRSNYRTLLQKLRLHPDLGGENWNASLVNQAYTTLKNPAKRADYDRELLARHHISHLSQGHLRRVNGAPVVGPVDLGGDNARHYYRVLQVQPDAPQAIIDAGYRSLRRDTGHAGPLLEEAYRVLSNSRRRAAYDALLTGGRRQEPGPGQTPRPTTRSTGESRRIDRVSGLRPQPSNSSERPGASVSSYQPVIHQFCVFCKTRHLRDEVTQADALCDECASPLFSPPKSLMELSRHQLDRVVSDERAAVFVFWPSHPIMTALDNFSPTGLGFRGKIPLGKEQIVKIDCDGFKATGKVAYSVQRNAEISIGIRFLTVQFAKSLGNFVATTA